MPGSSWPVHKLIAEQRQELEERLREHKPDISSSELDELVQELEIATGCYLADLDWQKRKARPSDLRKKIFAAGMGLLKAREALDDQAKSLIMEALWNDPRLCKERGTALLESASNLLDLLADNSALDLLLDAISAAENQTRRHRLMGDIPGFGELPDEELDKIVESLPPLEQRGRAPDIAAKGFALLVGAALEAYGFTLTETRARISGWTTADSAFVGSLKVLLQSVSESPATAHNWAREVIEGYDLRTHTELAGTTCWLRLLCRFGPRPAILPPQQP